MTSRRPTRCPSTSRSSPRRAPIVRASSFSTTSTSSRIATRWRLSTTSCCARRVRCRSFSPAAPIHRSHCRGSISRAGCSRSAPVTSRSPSTKPRSSSASASSRWRPRTSRPCGPAPKGGSPGCNWLHYRYRAVKIAQRLSRPSQAVIAMCWVICWKRCWTASLTRRKPF